MSTEGELTKLVSVHEKAFFDLDHDSSIKAVAGSCYTDGGKQVLNAILQKPIADIRILKQRTKDLQSIRTLASELKIHLETVSTDEEGAVWCSRDTDDLDDDTLELLDDPYFSNKLTRPLNRLWPALWANNAYAIFAAPALALAAPMSYVLAPYMMIRMKLRIPIDFKTFIKLMYHSIRGAGAAMNVAFGNAPSFAMQLASVVCTCVMYFQAVMASFKHSFALISVARRVTSKMNCLIRILDKCDKTLSGYHHEFFCRWLHVGGKLDEKTNDGVRPTAYPEAIVPWKTGFAKALCDFRKLDRVWIRTRLAQLFCIDALVAITNTIDALDLKPVSFLRSADVLLISGGRRMTKDDVSNDVALMRGVNGIVLTGQNASGKSTVLRMIGCVVLMAQTTGWAPARACALTPIRYLTTMMNIRDDPEAGRSRFQNELQRAGECVEAARTRPRDTGLLLMDEIFGGTDPSQGDVCGSKVLSSLADTSGCLYLLATHQKGLVEHSRSLSTARQFKMIPNVYKMILGVNDRSNASKLFQDQEQFSTTDL